MTRWGRLLAGGGVALGLLLAGCGDDDSATDGSDPTGADVGEGAAEADSLNDDGSSGEEGGAGDAIGDLAVPLPPGADAVARSEAGPVTIIQFIVPLDQQEAAIAFYDEWTAAQSDEYQRNESAGGGVSWQNAPESGADKNLIVILTPLEGDDFVPATLTIGPLE